MNWLGLASAIVALALPSTSAAADEVVPNQALSQRVAAETYQPTCSPVVIETGPLQNGPQAIAETDVSRCLITFAPGARALPPDEVCGVMVHEYGHLATYSDPVGVTREDGTVDHFHSPDPTSIMYPEWRGSYEPCNDAGEAALAAVDRIHWLRHVVADRQRAVRTARNRRLLVHARARLERALRNLDPAVARYAADARRWSST